MTAGASDTGRRREMKTPAPTPTSNRRMPTTRRTSVEAVAGASSSSPLVGWDPSQHDRRTLNIFQQRP